jgi:hypothetical protein
MTVAECITAYLETNRVVYDNPDYPWVLMVMNTERGVFEFVYRSELPQLVTDYSVLVALEASDLWFFV